ncbi:MAG: M16 family metallopeptidase, partial [Candidatus Methylomirabilales bacterium]
MIPKGVSARKPSAGFSLCCWALILALWACGWSSALASDTSSMEKIDARASLVLGNGLEVHVVQTPSPLVASLAIVKAGSRDEDETVRGVSHLLEHLLFDGTERRTKEGLFQEIYGMGGYINGFTREDFTGYILMAHPDFFEKLLDIQADLLFHAILDPEKLTVTKGVVQEEIRQALTNPAYREEVLHKANLYAGTPYASPTLGTEEGIARMARDQILGYYKRYYVPNNMVLVVIGPLHPQEVFKAATRRFSPYSPAPLPQTDRLGWPSHQKSRALVFETEATRKAIMLSLRLDHAEREDLPLLDLLAKVLNTRIGQAFERPLEPQVFKKEAALSILRDLLTLDLFVTFPQETDEDRVLRLLLKEMAGLAQDGVEEGELDLAKRELQANEVFLRERIHYYAMEKAGRIVALGPEELIRYLPRLKAITREEVSRAARRILADPKFTASIFLPRAEGKQTRAVVPPPPEKVILENGLTLIAQEIPGSEVLAIHVLVRHRSAQEPEKRAGIAEFLHRMLLRGTKNRTAEAITKALQAMGGKLEVAGDPTTPFGDFYTSREFSFIRLEALAAFYREALDLLQDLITHPAFPPEEVERVRAELLSLITARAKNPKSQSEDLLSAALY